MNTLPSAARGAPVIVYCQAGSSVSVLHTGSPDAASRAISRPSSVAMTTLPSHTASPRVTTSQQAIRPVSRGTSGS